MMSFVDNEVVFRLPFVVPAHNVVLDRITTLT